MVLNYGVYGNRKVVRSAEAKARAEAVEQAKDQARQAAAGKKEAADSESEEVR